MVEEHQIIILDSGSTTWCMASHLRHISNLMVVTNGMNVAEECSNNENTTVFLLGASSDIYEAEIKRAMIAAGQKVVILVDHSKFLHQGLVSFSSFQDVDIVITSDLTDEETIKQIESFGVKVVVCPVKNQGGVLA